MKKKSKPSTAKCNAEIYSSYLMSEPNNASCLRLSEIMPEISHDSVNRFLNRERFNGHDLKQVLPFFSMRLMRKA